MSEISARPEGRMRGSEASSLRLADWLGLAAAPSFAAMALLTSGLGGGKVAMVCGAMAEPSLFGGMAPMYLLMSVFHAAPWLKLSTNLRN